MQVHPTPLCGVLLIEPRVHHDGRGFFLETYRRDLLAQAGIDVTFVQDNHSRSVRHTLRGLHYQRSFPQAKLIRVVHGEVLDVLVDLRRSSETFGKWWAVQLSDANHLQLYVPPGLAHGFCVLSEEADLLYQCSEYYHREDEYTIAWNDPQLKISWPVTQPIMSARDQQGLAFTEAPMFD